MDVRPVTTRKEREAVYRFRYDIYVALEGRTQKHVDHRRGMVEEPLDRQGVILAAFDGERVVGTQRTNFRGLGSLDYYDSLYGIDKLPKRDQARVSITTKLMVDPDYRGSSMALRLAKLAYRTGLEAGTRWDFIDSRAHTLPYFNRLGYRVLDTQLDHPEYGMATLLKLDIHDLTHFEEVSSPFCSLLEAKLQAQLVA
ncbi:MAG: hypothetical protein ACI841_004357 [Planctomycetota bacterium]|jgi:hypothetical protein